jgi:RNA polymerase sigma factor (sigma-70 family)
MDTSDATSRLNPAGPPCHIPGMQWHDQIPAMIGKLTGFLRRRGKTTEETEDLIQEAFFKLERYCQGGNEVESAEAFLKATLKNMVVTEHRRSSPHFRTRVALDTSLLSDSGPRPDDALLSQQCLILLQEILDRLGRRTRDMYFMHRLGGFSYADIAARFNCSVSLVEKHIANAAATITYERLYGKLKDNFE